jgi:hypothetical protein
MFPRANFGSIFLKLVGLQFIEDPSRPLDILSITPNLVFGPGSKALTADDIRARLKLSGNDILFDMSDFVTGSTSTLEIALAPASPSAVPEPMSLALFGTAVPALLLARRARRRPR